MNILFHTGIIYPTTPLLPFSSPYRISSARLLSRSTPFLPRESLSINVSHFYVFAFFIRVVLIHLFSILHLPTIYRYTYIFLEHLYITLFLNMCIRAFWNLFPLFPRLLLDLLSPPCSKGKKPQR